MLFGNNQRALLYHILQGKQIIDGIEPGHNPFLTHDQGDDGIVSMVETKIYVGLNDCKTREQIFETEKYLNLLKEVCRNYHVAFSVDVEEGGYFHEDGEYTEETSFVLVIVNAKRETIQEIANDLCTFFHQESVLVTENLINGYFITGKQII